MKKGSCSPNFCRAVAFPPFFRRCRKRYNAAAWPIQFRCRPHISRTRGAIRCRIGSGTSSGAAPAVVAGAVDAEPASASGSPCRFSSSRQRATSALAARAASCGSSPAQRAVIPARTRTFTSCGTCRHHRAKHACGSPPHVCARRQALCGHTRQNRNRVQTNRIVAVCSSASSARDASCAAVGSSE